jgi:NADH-quinone oxidoreductase subunit M
MPIFAAFFMVFALSNIGFPGTSGFVGEFLIILSSFKASFWICFFAAITLVIGAAYTLWMYKRVFYGAIKSEGVAMLNDANGFEIAIFIIMAIPVFFIGLYPAPLLAIFHSSIGHLLEISMHSKL